MYALVQNFRIKYVFMIFSKFANNQVSNPDSISSVSDFVEVMRYVLNLEAILATFDNKNFPDKILVSKI